MKIAWWVSIVFCRFTRPGKWSLLGKSSNYLAVASLDVATTISGRSFGMGKSAQKEGDVPWLCLMTPKGEYTYIYIICFLRIHTLIFQCIICLNLRCKITYTCLYVNVREIGQRNPKPSISWTWNNTNIYIYIYFKHLLTFLKTIIW